MKKLKYSLFIDPLTKTSKLSILSILSILSNTMVIFKKLFAGIAGFTCIGAYGAYVHKIIQYEHNEQKEHIFDSSFDVHTLNSNTMLLFIKKRSNVPNFTKCCDYCEQLPHDTLTGPYRTIKHDVYYDDDTVFLQFKDHIHKVNQGITCWQFVPALIDSKHKNLDVIGSFEYKPAHVNNSNDILNHDNIKRSIHGFPLRMTIYNKYWMVPGWLNDIIVRKDVGYPVIWFDD